MTLVEVDDFVGGLVEYFARFVFDKDGMSVSPEKILKKEETCVTPYGCRVYGSLIVHAKNLEGKITMDPRTGTNWLLVVLNETAGGATDARRYFVNALWCEFGVHSGPR